MTALAQSVAARGRALALYRVGCLLAFGIGAWLGVALARLVIGVGEHVVGIFAGVR
jgi:hypothetical protein